jgi:dihydrofolate reductase
MFRQFKQAVNRDTTVSGTDLAAQALATGLVDELQLFLVPATLFAAWRRIRRRDAAHAYATRTSIWRTSGSSASARC